MCDEFKILANLYSKISLSEPGEEQQINRLNFLQSISMVQFNHTEIIPRYLEKGQNIKYKLEIDKVYSDYFNHNTVIKLKPEDSKIDQSDKNDSVMTALTYENFQRFVDFSQEKFKSDILKTNNNQPNVVPLQKKQILPFSNIAVPNEPQQMPQITQGFLSANVNKLKKRNKEDQVELDDSSQRENRKFKPPSKVCDKSSSGFQQAQQGQTGQQFQKQKNNKPEIDPRLKNLDPALIERIENEIIDSASQTVGWDSIAGLDNVRSQIEEVAIWPLMNPGLFEGITQPGRGLLLFGPPGTGKTMIGKAIANQAKATFFSISASSLTSKWIGEAEKLVRTLFTLASTKQPSVIFIDEVDSLLSARSDKENEGSRSMKTEFMVQLEGASRSSSDRVIFIGATNRPQELDDAIRRRFQKRLYIPLPNNDGRSAQFRIIFDTEDLRGKMNNLSIEDFKDLVKLTVGYSGADVKNLCTEAFFIPIRQAIRVNNVDIKNLKKENIRAVNMEDFKLALKSVKPTVMQKDLKGYFDWNNEFGTFNFTESDLNS